MPSLRETIIGYLRSLQERGIARLGIDEDCRPILREWMIAARSPRAASHFGGSTARPGCPPGRARSRCLRAAAHAQHPPSG